MRRTAEDWQLVALEVWAERGLDGVRIPLLAERLGVTKGSFYWHFRDHDDLIRRSLALWAERSTGDTIRLLEKISDPARRLEALFETAFDRVEHLRIEAAILAAGFSQNAEVLAFYRRVHDGRVRFVTRLYRELGFELRDARTRAVSTMGAYLGALQLALLGTRGLETPAELARLKHDLLGLFPKKPAPRSNRERR